MYYSAYGQKFWGNFWIIPDKNSMVSPDSPLQALKKSIRLFFTMDMFMLSVYFYYMGMLVGFYSVVYGTSLSRTLQFDDPKGIVGLHGIFMGVGQIIGSSMFMGSWTNKFGRWPIATIGQVHVTTAGVLILLNIPR